MMDDEASRTRGGFQAGGLGRPDHLPQQGPQQPGSNTGGAAQSQPPGQQSGAATGPTSQQRPPVQQPASQGGAQTGFQAQFGPDPAYFQQQPAYQQQNDPSANANANNIRLMVPQLAHMSDDYLLNQPIDAIYRLCREEKHAEAAKAAKGLETKLHNNFKKAAESPVYMAGYDNRANMLHPARFLPGAGVPVQNLWLEARKQWGQDGTDAIGNYDLEALSCSGCVTARGWELLHKPGSPEISLKMFTVTNVGHMATGGRTVSLAGEDGITIHENLKELADMAEFKLAMRNLKLAAQLVAPWNFSFTVIDGFLQANDYMEKHMEGVKRAPILSAFVDHVLKTNAGLWVQEASFLDNAKLMAVWNSWWGSRRVRAKADMEASSKSLTGSNNNINNGGGKNKNKQSGKNNGGQKGWQSGHFQQGYQGGQQGWQGGPNRGWQGGPQQGWNAQVPRFSAPPSEANICRRFNEKGCQRTWQNCVLNTSSGPLRLYHLCNFSVKKDGGKADFCLGKHPRVDHKE